MAEPSGLAKIVQTTAGVPFTAAKILKELSYEPFLTAPLLYILTRGPEHLRQRVLAPFRTNLLAKNGTERLIKAITVLKVLVAVGLWKRTDQALTSLALNSWYLPGTKPMARWVWDGRTETVVITGGCSGFGYEMVKGFAGKARVVVLDITELPQELARCKSSIYTSTISSWGFGARRPQEKNEQWLTFNSTRSSLLQMRYD